MEHLERLLEIMRRLRDPQGGCPWDRRQTFASIVPHTLEEAYEVADAIEGGNFDELREELGDLLFQVVFYAQIAAEEGRFDFADVAAVIGDKLVRRHPHVFDDAEVGSAAAQTEAWERHKAEERAAKAQAAGRELSRLDGVSLALPATVRAAKLQKRAARVGFDWPAAEPVVDKLREEVDELQEALDEGRDEAAAEELGDLLFTCVNLARKLGRDPESVLRAANRKFETRFRAMEADLGAALDAADAETLEAAWGRAKAAERP